MKTWKFGFAAVCSLGLALPACGSSDEGDDAPGGTGGTRAGSTGKGGAGSGGKAGSSSAGTSSAGKSGSGSGGSNGSGGSKSSTGGTNASSGTGGTGGTAECDPEAIAMDPMMGEVPEGCEAYAECVEPCSDAISECFSEGGACYGYLSCIGDCDCESSCVVENCISELSTDCSLCVLPASTCSIECQDEAASCM